jgi:hypothetical protein
MVAVPMDGEKLGLILKKKDKRDRENILYEWDAVS